MKSITWRELGLRHGPGKGGGEFTITKHKKEVLWVTISDKPPIPLPTTIDATATPGTVEIAGHTFTTLDAERNDK